MNASVQTLALKERHWAFDSVLAPYPWMTPCEHSRSFGCPPNLGRSSFRCRRPRAWRDANAMIVNLIHPRANMPQDVLDDLRVIDE